MKIPCLAVVVHIAWSTPRQDRIGLDRDGLTGGTVYNGPNGVGLSGIERKLCPCSFQ